MLNSMKVFKRIRCLPKLRGSKFSASATTKNSGENDRETHFGFEKVKESEKSDRVYTVFKNVADSYDVMNDVMSFGVHRIWKDIFMQRLGPTVNTKLLDVAGGTGDIAFRYLNYILHKTVTSEHRVTICDINTSMLEVGKTRANDLGYDPNLIKWQVGDAENLPFKDDEYTAYTIAFGIRNVTRIDKVLCEAYRVLKPGGRFLCLEFSHVDNEALQWIYDQYSFQVIPVMGQLITGQWQPYQYLVESIRQFPNQENFKSMIEEAGFRAVTYENLTMGMRRLYDCKMKVVLCLLVAMGVAMAMPQREGAVYSKEAIRQAQNSYLIPKDAQIQKVEEGIEIGAYESIPGNQRINLFEILGDQVPSEVINNLQSQVDQVGRS